MGGGVIEATKKMSKLGLVSLLTDGDTLKTYDEKLKTGKNRHSLTSACHKIARTPVKIGILMQGNVLIFHYQCTFVVLFFFSVIYFKTLSRVTHRRIGSRMFGEINR